MELAPPTLDEISLRILQHVREEFKPLKALIGEIPKTSIYRYANRLLAMGYLRRDGSRYIATNSGKSVLQELPETLESPSCDANNELSPSLETKWPFLSLFPTAVHQALAELILLARIVRRDGLTDDRHPAFILIGPTMRLKSWLIKAICYLTGSTPEHCRVPMMQVRGRGLLARLDAKGRKVYQSETLREAIFWAEEFSLADPRVKRDVEALLHGPKEIRIENQVVRVDAVPVLEMNPRRKDGSLEERIGLDVPRLRRAIVCDFTSVNVQSRHKAESQVILEKIKGQSPANLPVARGLVPSSQSQAIVEEAFGRCVRPECTDYVDPSRLLGLVAGAKSLLSEEAAARRVLTAYFTVAETAGFLRVDWRSKLARLRFGPSDPTYVGSADTAPANGRTAGASPQDRVITLDRDALFQRWRRTNGLR